MNEITPKLIEGFLKKLQSEEKSDTTQKKYIHDIRAFAAWLSDRKLDKNAVLEYKAYIMKSFAPASVNSMLSSLNSFFEYRGKHKLKVKLLKIQRQIFASRDRELTKKEYERLLTAAKQSGNKRLYYLLQTICATGIRVSEDI